MNCKQSGAQKAPLFYLVHFSYKIEYNRRMKLFFNRRYNYCHCRVARGFTLLELLVVVAVMGLLATLALVAFEGTQDDAKIDVAKIEMTEIRKALRMFYRDAGSFPNAISAVAIDGGSADDLDMDANGSHDTGEDSSRLTNVPNLQLLLSCHADPAGDPEDYSDKCEDPVTGEKWNPDTKKGWNGPYIASERVTVNLREVNGECIPAEESYWDDSLEDAPVRTALNLAPPCTSIDLTGLRDTWGNHYRLLDPANDQKLNDNTYAHARLVSFGPNGKYGGDNVADYCVPPPTDPDGKRNDDIVLCLLK